MDLQFGDYRVMRRERQVLGPDGPLDLSARAFDLLCVLLDHAGEVVSKDAIFAAVWPGVTVEENTLQVHVSVLRKALDPAMIVTVHGRGYKYAGPAPLSLGAEAPSPAAKAYRKPVIVVLPFENLSGDPDQRYFSDGITQDIIDRLSRFRMLAVIGHHSAFALRGTNLAEVRSKLAADYAVTGNVRRSATRIRIAARLAEAETGAVLWAEHYDRPVEDLFAVQDEVASVIASTLMGRVELEVGSRGSAVNGLNLSSYELVLQGIAQYKAATPAATEAAIRCLEEAIRIHPRNAEAHRYLGICRMSLWWDEFDPTGLVQGLESSARAVELDPASANSHQAHGICRLWGDSLDAARLSNNMALNLNPGDPDILIEAGVIRAYGGDLAAAHDLIEEAFRLNPLPPFWYPEFRAIALFAGGRYAEAFPGFDGIHMPAFDNMYALSCAGLLRDGGKIDRVRRRIAETGPKWDLMAGASREPYRDPEVRERLVAGLEIALSF